MTKDMNCSPVFLKTQDQAETRERINRLPDEVNAVVCGGHALQDRQTLSQERSGGHTKNAQAMNVLRNRAPIALRENRQHARNVERIEIGKLIDESRQRLSVMLGIL